MVVPLNIVFLILGAVGVIAFAFRDSVWKYLLLAVCGIFGLALIVSNHLTPAASEEPHLEATLIIHALSSNEPNFHFELSNTSGPQVTLLQYTYRTPDFSDGVDFSEKTKPTIPYQGKINIPGKLYSGILNAPTTLDLKLAYEITDEPKKSFHSEYRFLIDRPVKPQERLDATNWKEGVGKIDQIEGTTKEIIQQFSNQTGRVAFVFNEKTASDAPNIIGLHTPHREMIIDPIRKMVRFISQPQLQNLKIEVGFQHTKNGMHQLNAGWDDQNRTISLTIDGKTTSK